jgi:dsDNA-specific endonuclease/ATPase MutS2
MSNVNNIINDIRSIDNFDDMRTIIDAVNEQQKAIARMSTRKFAVGDYVYFMNKRGEQIDGLVTKVNPRTVNVQVGMTRWKVDASLLSLEPIKGAA